MSEIVNINAKEILDSRGNPTIEVDVLLSSGAVGRFSVPSGASTGSREAIELRDGDKNRYNGKGVLKAVENVNKEISRLVIGEESTEQRKLDEIMISADGTENKSKFGANAILGVSVAIARASANELNIPIYRYIGGISPYLIPIPMANIINGGAHADNNLDVQEFMIMPLKAENFKEALRKITEVFHCLKGLLKKNSLTTSVGDEGGFAPSLSSNEHALKIIVEAIETAGYKPGEDIYIALDVAASELYKKDRYNFEGSMISCEELLEIYEKWIEMYPILSIEDGFAENDWDGWKNMNKKLGKKIQIVGDDIFVTNKKIIEKGIKEKAANSILIKLNQIGTLTETIDAITLAQRNKWTAVVSHRSGETEDSTIADLAVALNTGFIKTGSLCRSDRIAKYNQLIRIENELENSRYGGIENFYNLK